MKRLAIAALLFVSFGVGCLQNQQLVPSEGPSSLKTAAQPVPPPVTPDQAHDPVSAREVLKRLEDEVNDVPPRQGIQPTPAVALPNGQNK